MIIELKEKDHLKLILPNGEQVDIICYDGAIPSVDIAFEQDREIVTWKECDMGLGAGTIRTVDQIRITL